MGIEIKFFDCEDKEVPARKALSSNNWTALAIGTYFRFESEFPPFGIFKNQIILTAPKPPEGMIGIRLRDEHAITARDYDTYRRSAQQNHMDLDALIRNGINYRWLEVGAGLGGLVPHLAAMQMGLNAPRPVIVDPVDYKMLMEALIALYEKIPSEFKMYRDYTIELIYRIRTISDKRLVELIPEKFEKLGAVRVNELRRQFFAVVDYGGPAYYSNNFNPKIYEPFLMHGGRTIILNPRG